MGDHAGEQEWWRPGGQKRRKEADLAQGDRNAVHDEKAEAEGQPGQHETSQLSGPAPSLAKSEGQAKEEGGGKELRDPRMHPGGVKLLRRSEEHKSELQSRENLVCRLLLEKKK